MTVERNTSHDVVTPATSIFSEELVKHLRLAPRPRTKITSPINRRKATRDIKRFLKLLGTFTIVVENGIIRHIWTSNLRHRQSISRALLNRRLDDLEDSTSRQIARAWKSGWRTGRSSEIVMKVPGADRPHTLVLASMPLTSAQDRVCSACIMARDITDIRESRDALEKSEALLAQAEELANVGSWDVDIENKRLYWSKNHYRMFGLPEEEGPVSFERALSLIHPEDRDRAVRDADVTGQDGTPLDNELRFLTPCGERIFRSRAIPVRDQIGKIVRVRGMSQDITEQRLAEQALREREALLAAAEQIANVGSYQYDLRTQKATMSPNLRRIYGMAPDEKWSRRLFRERLHPKDRNRVLEISEKAHERAKPFEYVTRYMRMETDVRILRVRGVPIFDNAGRLIKRTGVVQDITDQLRTEEDLRRLSQQLLQTRDQEQRRIARDLHETVGQSLAALKMTLGRVRDTMSEVDGLSRALLQSASGLADEAVREIRTISYLMHPPLLDEAGLVPALRWYARGFSERSGIGVNVQIPDDLPRPQKDVEIAVYRIVQEALTNVHRYSGSRTAQICVARSNGDLVAEIRDHGCGIVVPSRAPSAPPLGVGIAGMRERVKQLSGVLEIDTAPGKGTTVRATIPVAAKQGPHDVTNRQS